MCPTVSWETCHGHHCPSQGLAASHAGWLCGLRPDTVPPWNSGSSSDKQWVGLNCLSKPSQPRLLRG